MAYFNLLYLWNGKSDFKNIGIDLKIKTVFLEYHQLPYFDFLKQNPNLGTPLVFLNLSTILPLSCVNSKKGLQN